MKRAIRAIAFIVILLVLFEFVPYIFIKIGLYKITQNIIILDIFLKLWILVLPSIIYFYAFKNDIDIKKCFKLNKLSLKQTGLIICIGFLLQPLAMFISSITSVFFENEVAAYMEALRGTSFWLMLLGIAIMPAIMEELIMRGIILYESRDLNIKAAIVLNGILFGLLHRNPSQFFYAFVLGSLFAYIVIITNSLYSTILMHFIINGTQVVLERALGNIDSNTVITSTNQIDLLTKISGVGFTLTLLIIFSPLLIQAIKKLKSISSTVM